MPFDLQTQFTAPAPGVPFAASGSAPADLYQRGTTEVMHQPILSTARLKMMGASLDAVTPDQVLAFVARRVEGRRKGLIANHNLHSLFLLGRDPRMAAFYDKADLIQIDSIPLILWGRLLGMPLERAHRSTYLDWRDQFWQLAADRGWRVFLLGSAPGVADRTVERLKAAWPQVTYGSHHGYFDHASDSADNAAVLAQINAFRPDIVLVGMGMPLQEAWIAENIDRAASGVMFSVGGAFDYEAGVQVPSPRWLGMIGLEWLFRFALQPRRLFTRYFVEPWSLMGAALDDLARAWKSRAAFNPPLSSPSER